MVRKSTLRGAQIVHHLHDLFAAFAQTHHQAGLGEAFGISSLACSSSRSDVK